MSWSYDCFLIISENAQYYNFVTAPDRNNSIKLHKIKSSKKII